MLLERHEVTRQVQGSPNVLSVSLLTPGDLHQAGGEGLVLHCLALRAAHLGCQQLTVESVPTPPPHQGGTSLNIRSVLSSLWILPLPMPVLVG